jgi:hypothetical protein
MTSRGIIFELEVVACGWGTTKPSASRRSMSSGYCTAGYQSLTAWKDSAVARLASRVPVEIEHHGAGLSTMPTRRADGPRPTLEVIPDKVPGPVHGGASFLHQTLDGLGR